MNAETIRRRFGSWQRAVEKAGLVISNLGKRYSETDYFENLLKTWTHYGRQPTYGEMDRAPSRIRAKAYDAKWGTWRKALKAFLERVNADVAESQESKEPLPSETPSPASQTRPDKSKPRASANTRRQSIPLGLRYDVLRRDRFRCVICGASPSSKVGCELHADRRPYHVPQGRPQLAKTLLARRCVAIKPRRRSAAIDGPSPATAVGAASRSAP